LADNSTHLLRKLLTPGIGVKRWIALLILGSALIGAGIAVSVVEVYRIEPDVFLRYVALMVDTRLWWLAGIVFVLGVGSIVLAVVQINRSILKPLAIDSGQVINAMVEHRQKQRGPNIVAVGGGTGMPTLLRGLKEHTSNLTAIVTVADDGGSSGRLRREQGLLPPGDFRNNIVALARDESLMTQLFQYRFGGEGGLEGHSFGNLLIAALNGITGSFEEAIVESSRVLAVRGKVLPSTLEDVTLMADLKEDQSNGVRRVSGESQIPHALGAIERVYLQPDYVPPYPDAVREILQADLIVMGPGSLYTSILPNLLIKGIAEAIRSSRALKVYVCNVATQTGETDDYSVEDHLETIEKHTGPGICDVVLINNDFHELTSDANFAYVKRVTRGDKVGGVRFFEAPLVDSAHPWRHDSKRLGEVIIDLLSAERKAASLIKNN